MPRWFLLFVLFINLALVSQADPLSELQRASADAVIVLAFDLAPSEVPPIFPEDPPRRDGMLIEIEPLLWEHLSGQQRLSGCVAICQAGYVVDVALEDKPAFQKHMDAYVGHNSSWEKQGENYKDYFYSLQFTPGPRMVFGETEAVQAYVAAEQRLASHPHLKNFPYLEQSDNYVYFLSTDKALKAEPEVLAITDPDNKKKIDKVFGSLPSYPDLTIVSNRGKPFFAPLGDRSIDGLVESNRAVKGFYEEFLFTLSLRTRMYLLVLPPLQQMLGSLENQKTTPAKPLFDLLQQVFAD